MKKLLLGIFLLGAFASNAQEKTVGPVGGQTKINSSSINRADTEVSWGSFNTPCGSLDSLTFYTSTSGGNFNGFVTGTNGFGDVAKGTKFSTSGSLKALKAYYSFKSLNGAQTGQGYSASAFTFVNDTTLGAPLGVTAEVAWDNIDTIGNATVFAFASPVAITGGFVGMIQVLNDSFNLVSLYSTRQGCATAVTGYEIWNDMTFTSIEEGWGVNLDVAVAAVFEGSVTNVNENLNQNLHVYSAGKTLFLNVNDVTINNIKVIDLSGKTVAEYAENNRIVGNMLYNLNHLNSGVYIVNVNTASGVKNVKVYIQ